MLHKKKTLHEDLNRMGLGMDGEVRNGGGDVSINESIMDNVRKAVDKKIADIKSILASMTLKKPEAERALQIVKERFANINVCDFIADASCPIKGKAEGVQEALGKLKKYIVSVAEVYIKDIHVEAKNEREALEKAQKEVDSGVSMDDAVPEYSYTLDKEDWGVALEKGQSIGLKEAKDVTGPTCDVCGKRAVVNYQKVWVKYPVDGKGGYGKPSILDDQDPSGEENLHFCKDHDDKENRPA